MTIQSQVSFCIPALPPPSPQTYEELVGPHLQMLKRMVKNRLRNSQDADDVIQQTLLLAFRHLGQFRFEASFGTWLCRIAINVIRARLRSPAAARTVFADHSALENLHVHDPRLSPFAAVERKQAETRLHQAISQLPDIYRTVIELRDLRDLSIHETAQSLRMSKPAIKSRHHRARRLLHKLMSDQN